MKNEKKGNINAYSIEALFSNAITQHGKSFVNFSF